MNVTVDIRFPAEGSETDEERRRRQLAAREDASRREGFDPEERRAALDRALLTKDAEEEAAEARLLEWYRQRAPRRQEEPEHQPGLLHALGIPFSDRDSSQLVALLASGEIGLEEWGACEKWRHAIGGDAPGSSSPEARPFVDTTPKKDDFLVAQVNAKSERARIRDAIGEDNDRLLALCVLSNWPWTAIGREIGVSDKTARERVVESIRALNRFLRGYPTPCKLQMPPLPPALADHVAFLLAEWPPGFNSPEASAFIEELASKACHEWRELYRRQPDGTFLHPAELCTDIADPDDRQDQAVRRFFTHVLVLHEHKYMRMVTARESLDLIAACVSEMIRDPGHKPLPIGRVMAIAVERDRGDLRRRYVVQILATWSRTNFGKTLYGLVAACAGVILGERISRYAVRAAVLNRAG